MKFKFAILVISMFLSATSAEAQMSYSKYIAKYQKAYVKNHEVVKKADRKYFRFFPASSHYKLQANFTRIVDSIGFMMPTSGTNPKRFFKYGKLDFTLDGKPLTLTIYQNEALMNDSTYRDHLFLPFTDITSGEESYGGGRYIDLEIKDIQNNQLTIDFNKAYNPYCVYSKGYNCPIPPRENDLPVAIKAGEKDFAK